MKEAAIRIYSWPDVLPQALHGVPEQLARRIPGAELVPLTELGDLVELHTNDPKPDNAALLYPEASVASERGMASTVRDLELVLRTEQLNIVNIISDSFLGVERKPGGAELVAMSALIVALARSAAVTRGSTTRVNTICIPGRIFGCEEAQRGPLRHQIELEDVVEAACFFLDPENTYLNGQTLFVDGGRHLFSSLSA